VCILYAAPPYIINGRPRTGALRHWWGHPVSSMQPVAFRPWPGNETNCPRLPVVVKQVEEKLAAAYKVLAQASEQADKAKSSLPKPPVPSKATVTPGPRDGPCANAPQGKLRQVGPAPRGAGTGGVLVRLQLTVVHGVGAQLLP
jgi:hypothetical protein